MGKSKKKRRAWLKVKTAAKRAKQFADDRNPLDWACAQHMCMEKLR